MKGQVARFQELGFPVWLDDFGRGYSSLEVVQSIAYGYAHCETQTDLLEEAEKLADQRMYEKKKAMKDSNVLH